MAIPTSKDEVISEPRAHSLYVAFLKSEQNMKDFADSRSVSYDAIKDWFHKFRQEGALIVCPR